MKTRVSRLLSSTVAALLLATPALARAQADEQDVVIRTLPGDTHPGGFPGRQMMLRVGGPLGPASNGIPPHLVEKLGIPRDVAQRVQDLTFEANENLIPLEADLKRAQLRLERLLSAASPDEKAVLTQVEEVGRAETAVRRNRTALMVQIKKQLGPDLWQKLEAEMGPTRFERHLELRKAIPGTPGERRLEGTPPPRKP